MFNPFTLNKRVTALEGKVAQLMAQESDLDAAETNLETVVAGLQTSAANADAEIKKLAAEIAAGGVIPQTAIDRLNAISATLTTTKGDLDTAVTAGG